MTNPTPHGQVLEALIDLIDAYAETHHHRGGIYNARTEAARKAVIEALSGVQALSAAPAVPAGACGYFSFSDECGFDRHDTADAAKAAATEMLADIRRELGGEEWPMNVESICWGVVVERAAEHETTTGEDGEKYCDYVLKGASPTPPAEQQAPTLRRVARTTFPSSPAHRALHAFVSAMHDNHIKGDDMRAAMLWFLGYEECDVTLQQAAPKAAPVEQDDHQILAITTAYEQGVGKGHQAYNSGKEIANPYSPAYRCDLAWQYGYKEGKEQAKREAKAAPQQEAQEPVAWLNPWRADQVTTDYDAYGEHGIPLYTAPQPAPAPLSDDVSQKTWALLDELEKLRGADRYDEDWDTLNKRDDELRAAIAAQGGTP